MELSPSQSRFQQMLGKYAPYLLTLWDWDRAELQQEMVQRYMADFAAYDEEQLLDMAYSGMEWPIKLGLVTTAGEMRSKK